MRTPLVYTNSQEKPETPFAVFTAKVAAAMVGLLAFCAIGNALLP